MAYTSVPKLRAAAIEKLAQAGVIIAKDVPIVDIVKAISDLTGARPHKYRPNGQFLSEYVFGPPRVVESAIAPIRRPELKVSLATQQIYARAEAAQPPMYTPNGYGEGPQFSPDYPGRKV